MLKTPKFRSKAKLQYCAGLGCIICGRESQAHHLLRTPGKGMGVKSGDDWTLPLCPEHHNSLHASGNETKYLQSHGIDGAVEARRIHQGWLVVND
jgi:hypothetical protein